MMLKLISVTFVIKFDIQLGYMNSFSTIIKAKSMILKYLGSMKYLLMPFQTC